MSNLLNNEEFETAFVKEFTEKKIQYRTVGFGESKAEAYAFFISFLNEADLCTTWAEVRNFVAYRFQANVNDEFRKWNIYLFFILPGPISLDIKYRIENDTFSSRKVIIEKEMNQDDIITEHIINKLSFNTNAVYNATTDVYNYDEVIKKAFETFEVKGKKKVTLDSKKAFDEISEALKK
jgi:hypothetical protein